MAIPGSMVSAGRLVAPGGASGPQGLTGPVGPQGPPGSGGSGGGDMTKAVYDVNGNSIVDAAESVPWTGVTGKPATFPPDSTAMLKSVYDTNADGVVDVAASANAVAWGNVTGKPTLLDPGTWTTLTLSTGWTGTGQYRIESNSTIQTVFFRGKITQASGAALLAFNLPAAARPSAVRMHMLGGMQTEGETLYHANVNTTGDVTITPVARAIFTWPVTTTSQDVYLDGLMFSL